MVKASRETEELYNAVVKVRSQAAERHNACMAKGAALNPAQCGACNQTAAGLSRLPSRSERHQAGVPQD